MKTFQFIFISSLLAGLASAQTPPARPAPDHHGETIALETMVVSAGSDIKSAFDLAQGTSVLVSDLLRRSIEPTLGATLAATPGVNSSYYGPGASRPIIRGLSGDRVRILDNGIGSLDASNVSPDHNVSVEPLLVDRIEVLRGPATLLYGSSAVGGVVNVIDNRIPTTAPDRLISGRMEFRYDSAAHERTGVLSVTTGNGNHALQISGLRTETGDVRIPGFADPENPADRGRLVNSAISTKSLSLGGAHFGATGSFGMAVSEYDTTYGVPVDEPIGIDMKQRRADVRAELTQSFAIFKSARFRFGLADYTHAEVDTVTGRPNTRFRNKSHEGRLELLQQEAGKLSGTIGLQTSRSDFSAAGEEVVTPPTLTDSHALFALESYEFRPDLTLQFGGRFEFQSIRLGVVDPLLPVYPGYAARTGARRNNHGFSISTGTVYYPAQNYSFGFSLTYTQRLPAAQEVFSNGPHGGTNAYEIGSTGLGKETSIGLDVTLRKREGFVTGLVGGFVSIVPGFIFQQKDPARYFDEDTGNILPRPVPPGSRFLPIYQFVARDAVFHGGEAELSFHLVDTGTDRLHLDLTADYVQAQQTVADQPLPRMPPLRLGVILRYETGPWKAGVGVRHSFRQDRIAPDETETAGYTLVGADFSYRLTRTRGEWEMFARGSNLTDQEARVSTSFLKEVVPLPGRSATLGIRCTF